VGPHVFDVKACGVRPHSFNRKSHQLLNLQIVSVPKVGSRTLRHYVGHQGGRIFAPFNQSLPTVVFLRDPLDRFVSAFKEVFFFRHVQDLFDPHVSLQENFDAFTSDFLAAVRYKGKYYASVQDHFRSATQCVCAKNGTCPRLAHVGRIEHCAEDWNKFLVPLYNITPVEHLHAHEGLKHNLTLSDAHAKALCRVYYHDYCCFDLPVPDICDIRCGNVDDWQPSPYTFIS
jgi:hypothetical protein